MDKILIPVDGSEVALHAVQYVIEQNRRGQLDAIFLINVQPGILSGDVKRFISQDIIDAYQREEGEKALAAAKSLLDSEGLAYTARMLVGHIAESIVSFAQSQQCSSIVMGGRGLGSVMGMLLGSITTKVLVLSEVPVTVVK
jgi:nucleotide-binding universal stress UspA family protein